MSKFSVKKFRVKAICCLIIVSLLTVSTPAVSESMREMAERAFQDARFGFLSSRLAIDLPVWFAAFFTAKRAQDRRRPISTVRIFPGSGQMNLKVGQEVVFAAIAYDSRNEPISGVRFEWTSFDIERSRDSRFMVNSTFTPQLPGTYTIRANASGHQAEVQVTVTPRENPRPSNLPSIEISSRTGIIARHAVETDEKDAKSAEESKPDKESPASLGEQWDDSNWISADDPGNVPGNPPGAPADDGAGNGNFQLSAPVISLPGRGIDLALNLTYNSRVWNKSGNELTYDIDRGFPAPGWSLGFGKIAFMGPQGGCMVVDADGTRHGYTGIPINWSSRTSFTGHTLDGSFIDYNCEVGYSQGPWGTAWAKFPNGTTIQYSAATNATQHLYPTLITDAQGNFITITYRNNNGPAIETVTDTMGRVITFHYDSLNRLISIEGPRYEVPFEQTIRTLLRIHYKSLTLNYSFGGGITPIVRQSPVQVIDAIYYPATNTGYWFGDSNSYSSYGMITKVIEKRGVEWSPGPEEQGTITKEGSITKQADYNYPLTTLNETGRTNGIGLTDAPTYETLTESWDGADVAAPAVTTYAFNNNTFHWDGTSNSPARSVTVTQPNGIISKQYSYRTPGAWTDGLVFADETIKMNGSTPVTIASSLVSWHQGNQPNNINYDSPRPTWAEVYDENGDKVKTVYTYGTNKFNQITRSCDYDDANILLRCSTAEYENATNYIGAFNGSGNFTSGRHIFNLVKQSKVENPDGTIASRTDYEYDNYQGNAFTATPGVIQHNPIYDPYTTETKWVPGMCIQWEMIDGIRTCVEWQWNEVSVYEPWTDKRGNVTKVTNYTDAQASSGATNETRGYDVTGNLTKTSSSCCEETSFTYDLTTHYAYPVSQTRGAADPGSPHRIMTSAVYDYNTGLVKQTTDANGRTSTTDYNPDTLRPVQSTSSTGAYTLFSYDDERMEIGEEVRESNGVLAGRNTKYLNGIGKVRREEALAPNGLTDAIETIYTNLGEVWKQSRPFRAGDTPQWTETVYDPLGRTIKVIEPDGSFSQAFYNETQRPDSASNLVGNTVRVVDAWGRERWGRYDQRNRLVEVVEPNPNGNGSIFTAGSLVTKYTYDTLSRLVKTEQGNQVREFNYDSLSRTTRQKLAEQTATLNDAGVWVGAGEPTARWGDAFVYDERSNLVQKTDARGVKMNLSYQLSGTNDPLNRLHLVSYDLTGPRDPSLVIAEAPAVSFEYMTSGDKIRVKKVTASGVNTEEYAYDVEGRTIDHTLTFLSRPDKPMNTSYLYDSLNRMTEIRYPNQYGFGSSPRKVIQTNYDVASRMTSLVVDGQIQASEIFYNASSQTTSIKIGASGPNQITETYSYDSLTGLLTGQKVKRGSASLLDFSYQYERNGSKGSLNGKTGHLTKIIDNLNNNRNREHEFDSLGRLTRIVGGNNLWTQDYSFDRYGNRNSVAANGIDINGAPITRDGFASLTYDTSSNRISTAGFQYDPAGNQIRALSEDGQAWSRFTYDAANRLVSVRNDGGTEIQSYVYGNSNNRLITRDGNSQQPDRQTFYAWAGGSVLAEYTETVPNAFSWSKSYVFMGNRLLYNNP